ncbi:hypothetical protein CL622_07340 [archaeon]|nr:hypothetical protein [archaeon]
MSDNSRESKNNVFTQDQPQKSQQKYTNVPNVTPAADDWQRELGLEIPIETVPLPSLGKVYSAEHALHAVETLEIKAMTAKEEDILTSRALIKNGTVVTKLLQSCIIDKNINVLKMLSGDRNALMVAIRITGYGANYDTEVECPTCSTTQVTSFDLANLPLNNLKIDPVLPGTNEFSVTLPKTKANVHFKFLTGADEHELTTTSKRKKKVGLQSDNLVTTRLQQAIVSINGRTDRTLISKFVTHMPAIDSLTLRNYIDDNEPGVDMNAEFTCTNIECGETSEVGVPLGVTFFWPNVK